MLTKSWLYWLTFIGLYFELIGSFLLTAEAIGNENLKRVSNFIKNRRILNFSLLVVFTIIIGILSKMYPIISPVEAIIIIFSLSLFIDFGPKFIDFIMRRLNRGTAGLTGFIIFAIGFCLQAYVSLMLLK